jgi:hypothetical protein
VALQVAWPEAVEQTCFRIWLACARNVPLACERAEELWPLHSPEDQPFQPVAERTWYAWVQRHRWAERAVLDLANSFQGRYIALQASIIEAGERGARFLDEVLAGVHDQVDPRLLRVKTDAARHATIAAGAGTFGTRDRVAQPIRLPVADAEVDFSAMSMTELARWEMDAIARSRNTLPAERKR